ncbi:MAG: sulfate adenylyltransferase subunit CysN [Spirochaetaceae bacterium]|nr:sulfate adenylyltransferase subunit CysN [Spirochaetaceae bacterium]
MNDTRDMLRFTTAGSVDDGKSTLIGRLLFDSKAIFQDQMEALEHSSKLRGEEDVNLALLTDGLRAEREQGITIDVAYRYFSTPKRKFIIADTPGHEQYTRNMVTGASTADLAVILIDARLGVLTQSKRHGFLASLLGIPHLLVAVNKMDLVGWSQERFEEIADVYAEFSEKLKIHDISFIPVSALMGDNIVEHGGRMDWYDGPTVLHYLEHLTIAADRNLTDFRFPVQYVIRPDQNFRGFAGRAASGSVSPGEEVTALPSGRSTRIKGIHTAEGEMESARAGDSVCLTLEDEIDLSRGEMLVRSHNLPEVGTQLDAMVCWMDEFAPLKLNSPYVLRHTTREVQAFVRTLAYRVDVNTLHRDREALSLELNDIGRLSLETSRPLFFDSYESNRETGGFILIDPATNKTVGAGIIRGAARDVPRLGPNHTEEVEKSANVVWHSGKIGLEERIERNGHRPACYWFTGLSGSGKSTLARAYEKRLFDAGRQVFVIDGDNVRHGLNGDLGFTAEDREENIRRVGHVARLMYEAGFIVLCCFISPTRALRDFVRSLFPEGDFREVHVRCGLEECIARDPKGLYKKALAGEIPNFTGVSAPYEEPERAEYIIETARGSVEECVDELFQPGSADGVAQQG